MITRMGYRTLPGDYINEADYVRHDPMKIALRLMQLVSR
jgi:hypothetical protein